MAPTLMNLVRQVMRPERAAFAIATCLDSTYAALYKSLSELVITGPPLLHQAGDDGRNPERSMVAWPSYVCEISKQG